MELTTKVLASGRLIKKRLHPVNRKPSPEKETPK